jgi:MYXO-CTERM domain-containing protein
VCDGKDNDCDGQTDEELTSMGQPCNTGLSGQCQSGTSACQSGKLVCVPPAGCGQKESPMTESGSTEPPATTDAGPQGEMTTPDSPGLTDANPTTNDGPQTTWSDKGLGGKNIQCQLSSECPGGQICINNQCYGGVSAQGCGCSTSSEHGQHSFWLMLLFLPFLLRRRSCPNA